MSIALNQIENKVRDDELINQVLFESLGDDPQAIIKSIVAKTEKERWEKASKNIDELIYTLPMGCVAWSIFSAIFAFGFNSPILGYVIVGIIIFSALEAITANVSMNLMPRFKLSFTTNWLVNRKKELDAPYLSEKITPEQLLLCADYFEKEPREIHEKIHEKCNANLEGLNSQSSKLSNAINILNRENKTDALGVLSKNRILSASSKLKDIEASKKAIITRKKESDQALKLVTDATDNIRQLVDALNITRYLEESPAIINSANKALDETSILLDKMLVASAKSVSSLEKISDAIEELKKEQIHN